ncbi:MAG: hypothetical protein J6S76_04225, partial [Clostridia bacterium]|nr:hypothetical protein [Clostridia bacterium]
MNLQNSRYSITVEDGIIKSFTDLRDPQINLADKKGALGTACYTRKDTDIREEPHDDLTPYNALRAAYTECEMTDDSRVVCRDVENKITAEYRLSENGLHINCESDNDAISCFGINVDLNFMGKFGTNFRDQLLPTSPYTSADGRYMYCIMTRPNGRFLVASALTECDGWKITYSPFAYGHYINAFQFLASFDKVYGGSGRRRVAIQLECADTLEEAYAKIQAAYGYPVCANVLSGGFSGIGKIQIYGDADALRIEAPDGSVSEMPVTDTVQMDQYGLYTITPIKDGVSGLNTTLWNGVDMRMVFDRSCDAIKKPYHCDQNLCEGGAFLWAMLLNMRLNNHKKYDAVVREELDVIMAKGEYVHRRTIVPHETEKFPAYHICDSVRIQEQFFGVSILMEAFRVYDDPELLEYAVASLKTLVEHHMIDGMITNGGDYTTVCCPAIPIVDMANLLRERNDERYHIFEDAALAMAEYLLKRGWSFPTEGFTSDLVDVEYEDGSISCTALALLYVCANLKYKQEYVDFAEQVLALHRAWTIYTPDARMYGSSFRWWETIWEGDGEGPAICAGHAWTIWKAEALFWYGVIKKDAKALRDSWNGFVSNFAKTQVDGTMYSCYEVDYIRGGGYEFEKQ